MASQVPSSPLSGGDDYFTLLRKARQRRSSGARSTLMDLTGLTETQRKSLLQAQSLADRFETELDLRQKALDDARRSRQQQVATDRRKEEQAEAARKLEKARKEMERLKTQAQTAAAAGDVDRAKAIAQAVKGVLRDISAALRTLHAASATAFLSGAAGAGQQGDASAGASPVAASGPETAPAADSSAPAGVAADGSVAPASAVPAPQGAPQASGQDLNGDGTVDAAEQDAVRRQEDQARQGNGGDASASAGTAGGSGVDPVLLAAQGDAARAVALARQIVSILRGLRPGPQEQEPEPADRQQADGSGVTSSGIVRPEDRPGRGYRGVVEQMSAEVEGLALGLVVTSGQTLNIQA